MIERVGSLHHVISAATGQGGQDEPGADIYARLLHRRLVFLSQHINEQSANLVIAQLLSLDRTDSSAEIQLIISASSGEVYAALALYDTLQQLQAPVRTGASGLVGTYGAMLLAAGSSGRRYAQANATIHLHQPLTESPAHTRDLGRHAEQLLRLRDQIVDLLARHTGQQPERIRQDMVQDPFLTPAEAVGYGLVDDILA
jgi:ATP-dependent Clp protease, protease subunit